jgi:hypothetical protein
MLKSQPLSLLVLLASGIAFAGSGCADGGESKTPIKIQTAGTGGAVSTGGMGTGGSGLVGSGGAGTGGSGVGGASGAGVTGGTSGAGVTGGTSGAGVTGGTSGAGVTGGTSGAGVTGGTSGTGGTGGTSGTAGTTSDTGGAAGTGGTSDAGGTSGTGGTAGTGTAGTAGTAGAANMVVLYDGSAETFASWAPIRGGNVNPWRNNADGTMTVQTNTGDIISKQTFQDVFIHVEYKTPRISQVGGGQERGNSGVYLKGAYELQVLDTFGLEPANNGCGAIYGIAVPLVSACHDAEVWNVYEAEFVANKCNGTQKTANANFVEVKLNDQVVHRNVTVNNRTEGGQNESCDPKGLLLQDHSSILPVTYRNIWVIPRTP